MSIATDVERQMLDLINAARANAGLPPLQLALDLNEAAEDHSTWMLETDRFSHTGIGGSSAGDRMADAGFDFAGSWSWGENIAWQSERGAPGISDDVADLFDRPMQPWPSTPVRHRHPPPRRSQQSNPRRLRSRTSCSTGRLRMCRASAAIRIRVPIPCRMMATLSGSKTTPGSS